MNKLKSILFACGLLVVGCVVGFSLGSGSAHAEPAPSVSCKTQAGGNQKKWEVIMNEWIAEGRTNFVPNPAGICAW